jgi:DME family drug/metabolite transporter
MTTGGRADDIPPSPAGAGSDQRGLLALAAAGTLWGSIGLVVRLLQDRGMPAISISFWRVRFAAVILGAILGPRKLREVVRQARRPGRLFAVALSSVSFQLLYFLSVRDVGVAVGTLIALGLGPVALTATESLAARTRPAGPTLVVLLFALGGLALVTTAGASSSHIAPHPVRGIIEAILSGLMYAASTSWSGPLSARLQPLAITFVTSAVGSVALLPAVAIIGWHFPRSGSAAAGTIWLGLVTTVIAYGLFYAGLRSTRGSIAMVLTLLEPLVAVLLAAAFLNEPLTITNILGGVLLLGAVVGLYLKPNAHKPSPGRPTPVR